MNQPANIAPATRQPRLFSEDELDQAHAPERPEKEAGRFTAAAFLQRYPDKYQLAIDYLGAGFPKIQISRLLQCSVHTLLAIQEANPQPIAQARVKQLARLQAGSELALESILEDLADKVRRDKIPTGTKSVVFGILHDKLQVGSGLPTEIIGHLTARPGHADAAAYAREMQQAEDCETIQTVTGPAPSPTLPEMDLPPGAAGGKGGIEEAEEGQDMGDKCIGNKGGTDCISVDKDCKEAENIGGKSNG